MERLRFVWVAMIVIACSHTAVETTAGPASVLEFHNGPARSGVYVDSTLTKAAAPSFHMEATFHAVVDGDIYAQPLFWDGGPKGRDLVLVATEKNQVYGLDASSGAVVWQRDLGTPVQKGQVGCGNVFPLGVTGTPVLDGASGTMFLDAMVYDGAPEHRVFALSVADGSIRGGWPLDLTTVSSAGVLFDSTVQNQRGALALLNGRVYVPYGGLFGDCGAYHGWLLGIPEQTPTSFTAWRTDAQGGGIWSPSGVASDGSSLYASTGNSKGAGVWQGGEAVIRFGQGPSFSGQTADYFAPINWQSLDSSDTDIGSTGPVLLDAGSAKWVTAFGKNAMGYLVDRTNMGGVSAPLASATVSGGEIITSVAAYSTAQATYLAFQASCPTGPGDLTVTRVVPGNPPVLVNGWCASQNGTGAPMVTTTDGHSEAIVWSVGAEGDNRLHGFDGDTGAVIYNGGSAADQMSGGINRFQTPILAKGRIFVAGRSAVYAFSR